jgi:hypothetical protein
MRSTPALSLAIVAIAAAGVGATPSSADAAGRRCATFTTSDGWRVPVYVRGTSCKTATKVLRRFVSAGGGTNERVMGWRCTSGSGGSFCRRGTDRAQTSKL